MPDPRLQRYLEASAGDALVTADPGLVRMLTGHVAEIAYGPSPFGLPALVVAAGDAPAQVVFCEEELTAAMATAGVTAARTLVDGASVPAELMPALPGSTLAPAEGLALLPATKTPAEVEAVEAALRLCEAGHEAARDATRAGATELDVWAAIAAAVERAAGARTTAMADLLSGPRTEHIGGPPGPRVLAAGDLVLCDLVPRRDGVWADSCATWAVTEPPRVAVEMHAAAARALRVGLDALRPGARAGDIDRAVRAEVEAAGHSYPHHTGHGVGFHTHEEPRIVPGGATVLEPGMVVALEPGAYRDGLGVRLEQVSLITANGSRLLSRHPLDL
jgi:Xaa-Pro dipeptidase